MGPRQPLDEWEFLPGDDELTETVGLSAEAAALHVEGDVHDALPAEDPGRAEVVLDADSNGGPVTYFEDEQPEGAPPWAEADDETEPDLEQVLESQHYAFGADEET
jgi:hypothetical protein